MRVKVVVLETVSIKALLSCMFIYMGTEMIHKS